jgi:hypothetical protein
MMSNMNKYRNNSLRDLLDIPIHLFIFQHNLLEEQFKTQ